MYWLVLYSLIALLMVAVAESFLHLLPFSPIAIVASTVVLIVICWITNTIFSKLLHAPTNLESVYISALILACITGPATSFKSFLFLVIVAVLAMSSKYFIAPYKKHIFNPVGFGVFSMALFFHQYATWWIGSVWMMPFVIVCGILITRKPRRTDMLISFFVSVVATTLLFSSLDKSIITSSLQTAFLSTPIYFFAFIMFTEPLTTPPRKLFRILYGVIVGVLFTPQFHFGSFHSSLELALLVGNIFSYAVSQKSKLFLALKQKTQITPEVYDFIFNRPKNFSFLPGQYMEWTLPHKNIDSRGNRRYFTLASSPTEDEIILGARIGSTKSSYKNALSNLSKNDRIIASSLAGDFILPKDKEKKLVFVAGGIGITPFRSMIQYFLDMKEKRNIILFYTAKDPQDFAYKEHFDRAKNELGIKVIYVITDKEKVPQNWQGRIGRIDSEMIRKELEEYKEYTYFLSGPNTMVKAFEKILKNLGVSHNKIKTDYFPGYV